MKGKIEFKDGKYFFNLFAGKWQGKNIRKYKSNFSTAEEAEASMRKWANQFSEEYGFENKLEVELVEQKKKVVILLDQVFREYLLSVREDDEDKAKYATVVRDRSIYKNHIFAQFGETDIKTLDEDKLQKYFKEKETSYSAMFIKGIYYTFNRILEFGISKKYITANPLDRVEIQPDDRKQAITIYSNEFLRKYIERIRTTSTYVPFMLTLLFGLTPGECYALRWSDFDFEQNQIRIERQMQKQDGLWCFVDVKYPVNRRMLSFDENTKRWLLGIKGYQESLKRSDELYKPYNRIWDRRPGSKKDSVLCIEDLVNVKPDGSHLSPDSNKLLARIAKDEFDVDLRFDNLRFTHTVNLLIRGIPPKKIQEHMGYGKIEQVTRLYPYIPEEMLLQTIPEAAGSWVKNIE